MKNAVGYLDIWSSDRGVVYTDGSVESLDGNRRSLGGRVVPRGQLCRRSGLAQDTVKDDALEHDPIRWGAQRNLYVGRKPGEGALGRRQNGDVLHGPELVG